MSSLRDPLIDATLREAVFDGFTAGTLARAAESVGMTAFDARRTFPGGINALLDAFSQRSDAHMIDLLRHDYSLPTMKIRERIATAVLVRLHVNAPYREAIRRIVGHYALPWNAPAGIKNLYNTVDAMWREAGDTSTDYNFYTKRLLLANVYTSTVAVWLNDTSPDLADTRAFLHRRIEDVMRIEKLKAKAREKIAEMETWLVGVR